MFLTRFEKRKYLKNPTKSLLRRQQAFIDEEGSHINPFSHCLFCVSRLTAICHMRHPYKADLGKK
jgi:hypothetical protein